MPKANLKILKSPAGPFHKGECSVCGETFNVSPREADFKREMLEQFDAHLQLRHPRQWEFQMKKKLKQTRGLILAMGGCRAATMNVAQEKPPAISAAQANPSATRVFN